MSLFKPFDELLTDIEAQKEAFRNSADSSAEKIQIATSIIANEADSKQPQEANDPLRYETIKQKSANQFAALRQDQTTHAQATLEAYNAISAETQSAREFLENELKTSVENLRQRI